MIPAYGAWGWEGILFLKQSQIKMLQCSTTNDKSLCVSVCECACESVVKVCERVCVCVCVGQSEVVDKECVWWGRRRPAGDLTKGIFSKDHSASQLPRPARAVFMC